MHTATRPQKCRRPSTAAYETLDLALSRFDEASGIACRARVGTSSASSRLVTKVVGTPVVMMLLWFFVGLTSCTFEEGEPWGYVDAEMSAPEPAVGEAFEVDSFELEIDTVRLIETSASSGGGGEFDPQNPPPGCTFCHGGHCHCDGDLVSYDDLRQRAASGGGTTRTVVANLAPTAPIDSEDPIVLEETGVGEQVAIDTVEVQLSSLTVEGTLTRDGEEIPTTLSLPGIAAIAVSAPAKMRFGPDSPQTQHFEMTLTWSPDWFEGIALDELETRASGEILIASTSNRDQAQQLAGKVAESSIQVEPK